tara:strand:+ start:55 stop:417 length:363 start_codon:yes stop_codon:yes gene_type:complete
MAKEINASVSLAITTALGVSAERTESMTIDQSGNALAHFVQSIPSSGNNALDTGRAALGTEGMYFIKNLDSSNYVQIGLTGSYFMRLNPGESTVFRSNQAAVYAQSNNAACLIEVMVFED